jgi:hypothetical protein
MTNKKELKRNILSIDDKLNAIEKAMNTKRISEFVKKNCRLPFEEYKKKVLIELYKGNKENYNKNINNLMDLRKDCYEDADDENEDKPMPNTPMPNTPMPNNPMGLCVSEILNFVNNNYKLPLAQYKKKVLIELFKGNNETYEFYQLYFVNLRKDYSKSTITKKPKDKLEIFKKEASKELTNVVLFLNKMCMKLKYQRSLINKKPNKLNPDHLRSTIIGMDCMYEDFNTIYNNLKIKRYHKYLQITKSRR